MQIIRKKNKIQKFVEKEEEKCEIIVEIIQMGHALYLDFHIVPVFAIWKKRNKFDKKILILLPNE